MERLAAKFTDAVIETSVRHVPRGARADPRPWELYPELVQAVAERHKAKTDMQADPSPETQARWKAKREAADVEVAARQRVFRDFATTELNRPATLGRVTKILRRMEGAVANACPGQAGTCERGQSAAEARDKAETFARMHASVSSHTRVRRRVRGVKLALKTERTPLCVCGGHRSGACQPFSRQEMMNQLCELNPRRCLVWMCAQNT